MLLKHSQHPVWQLLLMGTYMLAARAASAGQSPQSADPACQLGLAAPEWVFLSLEGLVSGK